jgi:hypothetical protein
VDVNTSSNYTISVTGDMWLSITSPNGGKYLRSETNVPINGTVTDECSVPITGAAVNFSALKNITVNYCNPAADISGGSYNCSLNTSGFQTQGWDVKMNSSKLYYNYNETNKTYLANQRGFWVETRPVLSTNFIVQSYNSSDALGDGGWGEKWIFKVNATDEDNDTMNVKLWVNLSGTGAWSQPSPISMTNNTVQGINQTVTFTVYWPSYSSPGIEAHAFKFNVTDWPVTDSWDRYETTNGSFNIQKDDISFLLFDGNDTTVNRSTENQKLSVRVYDSDKGAYPAFALQGNLWITNDTFDNFVPADNPLVSGNWINYTFNPGCGPPSDGNYPFAVGPQKWKAGVTVSDA